MLQDRGQRDGEGPGERAGGLVAVLGQAGDDGPARRIGEGGEDAIERGRLKLNHMVH